MTHDFKRNGTTDLFAALNMATGEMITECRTSLAGLDVLAFFKKIDRSVPRRLDIHVVLDNLSVHKAPEVAEWLADPRRARWHLHFTPTSSSWLNLVKRWFKEVTDRRLRRGTFTSVGDLIDAIDIWVGHWNKDRSRSYGTPPPPRSAERPVEDVKRCHKSNPRRTTRNALRMASAVLAGRCHSAVGGLGSLRRREGRHRSSPAARLIP